jgi:outer membrane lipoprotein SlyB
MNKVYSVGAFLVAALVAGGCAEPQPYSSQYPSQPQPYPQSYPAQGYPPPPQQGYSQSTGTVDRIEVVQKSDPSNIAGTIIGGIVGGLIGHQIGGGTGNTAATIAGAAGGAYAGNQVEQRKRAPHESFRVTVRMDNGQYQTITTENITDLQTGDRVRIDGNRIARY